MTPIAAIRKQDVPGVLRREEAKVFYAENVLWHTLQY